MIKRFVAAIIAVSLILSMAAFAFGANESPIQVTLNDEKIILDNGIYLNEAGQLMTPLRQLAETLDYQVIWNPEDKSVDLSKDEETIQLRIGEANVKVNGESMTLGAEAVIKGNKTFIPVSFLSDAMDLVVGWDAKTQGLKIKQEKENVEDYFIQSEDKALHNQLDNYLMALEKHHNFHGSVLVAKDGKVLLNQGYGYGDFSQLTKNKSQTEFAIGSVTKQFTAMAIMQLYKRGLLKVEDPISNYFPDFPNGDKITIHHLLTHTSGLVNYTDLAEAYELSLKEQNPAGILNLIKDKPLQFQPGSTFLYNNTGYLLLSMIVEKVSGMSYEAFLKENIFAPLNMNNIGLSYGEDNKTHDATAYTGYLEVIPVDDEPLLRIAYGAGSLYATTEDLYRWDRALNTEQLVKKETLEKMFTGHVAAPGLGEYAYGWMVDDKDLGSVQFHNGLTFGFSSNFARYIDQGLTIIVLTNNRGFDTMGLTDTLAAIASNQAYEMPKPKKEIEIADKTRYDGYAGKYSMGSGVDITITRVDDKLFAQVTGDGTYEIYPEAENKFFYKVVNANITFITNEEGEATKLLFEQNGQKIVAQNEKFKEEKVPADIDPALYDQYVGVYELFPGFNLTITKDNDGIYAMATGQTVFEIFPESETEYFYRAVDAQITFVKNDKGQVTGLVLHQNGQDMPGNKIK